MWQAYVQRHVLLLDVPRQQQPVDVAVLVAAARQLPLQPGLLCDTVNCAEFRRAIPSTLQALPGEVLLLHLARNPHGVGQGLGGKVLTPLHPIPANHPEWPGLHLQAVLGHREVGAHWIASVVVGGVWWRVDSASLTIIQQDPYMAQGTAQGFTMDVLFFGQ